MGFMWLSSGIAGALEAGAIAFLVGTFLCVVGHLLGDRIGWRQGTAIGVALLATLVIAAGVDSWDLFYLSIVRMESPMVIERTLSEINDPGSLGLRVVFEFTGAAFGVMLGWYLASVLPASRRDRRD